MAKKRYRVQASATTKTYVFCWIAAARALKDAQMMAPGNFYSRMIAGVFAAFSVEGYLNDLGKRRILDWGSLERRLGPREKLLLIKNSLRLPVNMGSRPYQSLRDMLSLRHALAHAKTEVVTRDCIVDDPNDPQAGSPVPKWKDLCELRSVTRMVEDAQAIVRDLNQKAGYKRDPFASPGGAFSTTSELPDE